MPEDTRMEAERQRPRRNSLQRFDLLMKMAYLPGVLGILKREEIAKTVTMLLATLLGNEREKSTKDKRPQWQSASTLGPDSGASPPA